ncbi:hypothetical protein CDO73_21950 [Saccharibacillus sp. O23]|nr:hypothetical protein CDO73_21950 [Saccharibacillus sp. O23]
MARIFILYILTIIFIIATHLLFSFQGANCVSLVSAAQFFSQQQLLYISMFVFVLQVFFEIFFQALSNRSSDFLFRLARFFELHRRSLKAVPRIYHAEMKKASTFSKLIRSRQNGRR